jgi:hypothetical protein
MGNRGLREESRLFHEEQKNQNVSNNGFKIATGGHGEHGKRIVKRFEKLILIAFFFAAFVAIAFFVSCLPGVFNPTP